MRSKMRRLMAIFQLRTIDGSLFFKGHFSFHYCVPLIVGAVCRSLFLLWERLCGINASSPWPPHFAFSARQLHPRRTCLEWTRTLDQTPDPPFTHAETSSPLEGHTDVDATRSRTGVPYRGARSPSTVAPPPNPRSYRTTP